MNRIPAFICDLDGTIALHSKEERAHYDYTLVSNDRPNAPIISIVQRLIYSNIPDGYFLRPVFVTGRADANNGQVRRDTIDWLIENVNINPSYFDGNVLFMRPEFLKDRPGKRDYRPDFEVKEEIYHNDIEPAYDIRFAIDDRPQVLKMWHKLNIPTLAVGTPWIEF